MQSREGRIGLTLAALVMFAWLALHFALLLLPLAALPFAAVVLGPLLVCWLSVGLFIVAHDAIHGTLAPGYPRLCRLVGAAALRLYAGFDFDRVAAKHRLHHAHPGSEDDPDFHRGVLHPVRWYLDFMREYVSLPQIAFMAVWVTLYAAVLGIGPVRIALFWIVPLLASTVQLFVFGTYLPHRPVANETFADLHRARSLEFSWLLSLIACFHFGYHREHHAQPSAPWWRLPQVHARMRAAPR